MELQRELDNHCRWCALYRELFCLITVTTTVMKKSAQRRRKHRAGCSKAGAKKFALPADPLPGGAGYDQNLISWRRSLPSTASELILEWGRTGKARRTESGGWGSWGGDSQPLTTNYGVCGGAVSSLGGIRGGAPAAEGFLRSTP